MDFYPTMLKGAYDETLSMLIESRNYMAHAKFANSHPWQTRWFVICESMRVTSRLTQVMAWLLLQRAIAGGEIPAKDACLNCNRLSGRTVCVDNRAEREDGVPAGLGSLLRRSRHLYLRISRLEEMVVARELANQASNDMEISVKTE